MDALLITTHTPQFCHYLVRADIFKRRIVRTLLSVINMMPVYRIRDGFGSLKANTDIFANCYKLLGQGDSLIMFPEGNHDIRRVQRKLTKGISKIALGAMNDDLGPKKLQIVPVGLNYTAHKAFRSSIHIVFGKPIETPHIETTVQNQETFRVKVNEGLNDTHIRLPETLYHYFYSTWVKMKDNIGLQPPTLVNKLLRAEENIIGSARNDLNESGRIFHESLNHFNLHYNEVPYNSVKVLLKLLLALPFMMYGLVINGIPLLSLKLIVDHLIKDHVFDASIKFTVGYFLVMVNYAIMGTVLYNILSPSPLLLFVIILSWPISLLFYEFGSGLVRTLFGLYKFKTQEQWREQYLKSEQVLISSVPGPKNRQINHKHK